MAEAEVRKEPLLLFTEVKDQHEGRFSSLSIISCKNLAVAVNDHLWRASLSYHIGRISPNMGSILWTVNQNYTTGVHPAIALILHEGQVYALEAHNQHFSSKCHYNVWRMSDDLSAMRGDFGGKELAQGFRPTLCAHNSGWCCAVFEGSKYSVGKIRFDSPSLVVNWKNYHLHQIMISPNIALQGEVVILVFKSKTTSMMHSMIGSWNESGIDWKNEVSEIPSAGSFPSIALNSYGNVFLCHQNGYRYLTFMYGVLTKDKTIEWYQKLDTGEVQGEYPSVVFINDGNFL